jgi:hypothetical protein
MFQVSGFWGERRKKEERNLTQMPRKKRYCWRKQSLIDTLSLDRRLTSSIFGGLPLLF